MKLHIAATRVEEFRKVLTEEWAEESRLIRSITTREPLGWQGLYGEALGASIAEPERWRQPDGSYLWRAWDKTTLIPWPAAIVDECIAAWPTGCVFEKRVEAKYRTVDGDEVNIAGRLDAAWGTGIIEGKAKFGNVIPGEWADSLQWRFYLDACPWARFVEYRIHEIGGMYADQKTGELRLSGPKWLCRCVTDADRLRERRKDPAALACEECDAPFLYVPGGPRLDEIHVWRQWRQDDIHEDLTRWVEEFVAWAKNRGLTDYLRPWHERRVA